MFEVLEGIQKFVIDKTKKAERLGIFLKDLEKISARAVTSLDDNVRNKSFKSFREWSKLWLSSWF